MSPAANPWSPPRSDPRAEVACLYVHIGGQGKRKDHVTDLLLKRAKEVVKDGMVAAAERRGGKLVAWEEDSGNFLFSADSPENIVNCSLTAMDMLEQFPLIRHDAQLGPELERLMTIRITCDSYAQAGGAESGVQAKKLKTYAPSVSVENKVTLTERMFGQLEPRLQAGFAKWKHSAELGVDLYATSDTPVKLRAMPMELPSGNFQAVEADPMWMPSGVMPAVDPPPAAPAPPPTEPIPSRRVLVISTIVLAMLVAGLLVKLAWPKPAPLPSPADPYQELVQSEDWRRWRKQVHEKLAVDKITESVLADALKVKHPPRPEKAGTALRHDQAVAEVLMTYPGVRAILWRRFGIDENNFLGTGLSKPHRALNNYGAASVHEYLIPNLQDNAPGVHWMTLDPRNSQLTMTVQELLENDAKANDKQKQLIKQMGERVKERDTLSPAVIRFAILDTSKFTYSRKLGRAEANRVFASDLSEVWNARVRDAANLSGHKFSDGDTLYVWAFLPSNPDQVVPATWGEVLTRLPDWLADIKN